MSEKLATGRLNTAGQLGRREDTDQDAGTPTPGGNRGLLTLIAGDCRLDAGWESPKQKYPILARPTYRAKPSQLALKAILQRWGQVGACGSGWEGGTTHGSARRVFLRWIGTLDRSWWSPRNPKLGEQDFRRHHRLGNKVETSQQIRSLQDKFAQAPKDPRVQQTVACYTTKGSTNGAWCFIA